QGDPRWLLWVDVWSRTLALPELQATQAELDRVWHETLVALIPDEDFSVRLRAMLDGFSTQLVIGVPGLTREQVIEHALALRP
ncbi:MAG: TetR family transcriptional regulator C-terminal domain-containing protein, partial [Nonomuraea sp.]|nr:TetR family transcriptional regulator C-terminal domain-containing protein [Nonomuraea sp.]